MRLKKRIAYAASFGVDEIPENRLEEYEHFLKGFAAISVREKQAVKIVEQFEGCYAECVLDPTLLLTKDRWKELARIPQVKEKYVLKYLLGEEQSTCDRLIEKICGNIKVIDIKKLLSGKGEVIGPEEFLGFVLNAELICTDSFHASVFSTIFEKPFVIFERRDFEKDMSSRLDNLCDMLVLKEHRYSSDEFEMDKVMKPNYNQTVILLEEERKKSLKYLMNVIKD